jgi:hypothetical protein
VRFHIARGDFRAPLKGVFDRGLNITHSGWTPWVFCFHKLT